MVARRAQVQVGDGLADRHAAHPEPRGELALRRQRVAGVQRGHRVEQLLPHVLVLVRRLCRSVRVAGHARAPSGLKVSYQSYTLPVWSGPILGEWRPGIATAADTNSWWRLAKCRVVCARWPTRLAIRLTLFGLDL